MAGRVRTPHREASAGQGYRTEIRPSEIISSRIRDIRNDQSRSNYASIQERVVNAEHFRDRARQAREMAGLGQDLRLRVLLLDLASELELEAMTLETEEQRSPQPGSAGPWPPFAYGFSAMVDT